MVQLVFGLAYVLIVQTSFPKPVVINRTYHFKYSFDFIDFIIYLPTKFGGILGFSDEKGVDMCKAIYARPSLKEGIKDMICAHITQIES